MVPRLPGHLAQLHLSGCVQCVGQGRSARSAPPPDWEVKLLGVQAWAVGSARWGFRERCGGGSSAQAPGLQCPQQGTHGVYPG